MSDFLKVYQTYHNKKINFVDTDGISVPKKFNTIKKLDISLPNIILLDRYEFYDTENDTEYCVEKLYLELYIIGNYIKNSKFIDISSLIYFHKYTDITEDKDGAYHDDKIVVYSNYGYTQLTYKRRYINNNIGELINSYPDIKNQDTSNLLRYIHQNYELVKREVPLVTIPNDTKKIFVVDNKEYEAYSFEQAKFLHDTKIT